ncbi:Conserved_hypothetical protein [Hexamita inflata]|uniref:Transglutaminase-like domain-containing protein n=1 Tax=Hexamita inflata TaxID=28002 RepID=A0ABP1H9B4_9EUKA
MSLVQFYKRMLMYHSNGKQLVDAYEKLQSQLNIENIFKFDSHSLNPVDLHMVMVAVAYDNPQVWWSLDKANFMPEINQICQTDPYQIQFQSIVNRLKNAEKSDIRQFYDILKEVVENTRYNDLQEQTERQDSIVGCLLERKANCEGFAKSFQFLSQKLNLQATILKGCMPDETVDYMQSRQTHAWCGLCIKQQYFMIDPAYYIKQIERNGIQFIEFLYSYDDNQLFEELINHQIIFNEYELISSYYERYTLLNVNPFKVDKQFEVNTVLENVLSTQFQIVEIIVLFFSEMVLKTQVLHIFYYLPNINENMVTEFFNQANKIAQFQYRLDNINILFNDIHKLKIEGDRFIYLTISKVEIEQTVPFYKQQLKYLAHVDRYIQVYDTIIQNQYNSKYVLGMPLDETIFVLQFVILDNPLLWWLTLDVKTFMQTQFSEVITYVGDIYENKQRVNQIVYANTTLTKQFSKQIEKYYQCLRTVLTNLIISNDGDTVVDALIVRKCSRLAALKAFQVLCDQSGLSCTLIYGVQQCLNSLETQLAYVCYIQINNKYYTIDIGKSDFQINSYLYSHRNYLRTQQISNKISNFISYYLTERG